MAEKDNKKLEELLAKAKTQGFISFADLASVVEEDTDAYDELLQRLEDEGIEVSNKAPGEELLSESDIEALDDEDFANFLEKDLTDKEVDAISAEYENDLKNKDIDDIVSSISTPTQSDDPVRMYLREIGQIELLTATQEMSYSSQVQQGLLAQQKLDAIASGKKNLDCSPEEIKKLHEDVEIGMHARDILIEANLRLVVNIAKRYTGRGMQFQDLIQEGNMGLMKAVNKFDYTRGFKFSTYSTWWIKQAITRAIADQARTIRVPVHMVETINRMSRMKRHLVQELHREPTAEELSAAMHLSVNKVLQIQKISQEPISLETPIGEDEDSTLSDFVHDESTINPLEYTINAKYKEAIDKVLKTLTPREEKVLRLRYGLTPDGKHKTLEEIGKEFNVTRERIRQIAQNAIKRLSHQPRKNILSQFR